MPSSANSSAEGMKKTAARIINQVKASAPFAATVPIVSTPTRVQIRKKKMSKRPKCFLSFAFSTSSASVTSYGMWTCVSAIGLPSSGHVLVGP